MSRTYGLFGLKLFSEKILIDRKFEHPDKLKQLDYFNERRIADHVGITKEVLRLKRLIKQSGEGAKRFYEKRLELIVGDETDEDSIANSVFGKVRDVYSRTFNHSIESGSEINVAEKEALQAAKDMYQDEMDFVDKTYPPNFVLDFLKV